jgi:hypothetical protein
MVHPERMLGKGASLVAGMRIIDLAGLEKLCKSLRAFAKQLVDPDVAANASEVAKRLGQFELNADAFVNAFSAPVKA